MKPSPLMVCVALLADAATTQILATRPDQMLVPGQFDVIPRSRDTYLLSATGQSLGTPARFAPDRSVTHRRAATALERIDAAGRTLSWTAASEIVDFGCGADSHCHIVLRGQVYAELDANLNLVRTATLPGLPTRIALDASGRAWIAIASQPADILCWIDPGTPNVGSVSLPADFGAITDLLSLGSAAGDRVFVASSRTARVLEVDRNGVSVRTLDLPGVGPVRQLTLGSDRQIYACTPAGLWRIDDATGSAERLLADSVQRVDFDSAGGIWVGSDRLGYSLVDLTSRRQLGSMPGAFVAAEFPIHDDPSGIHLGSVVDPNGDWDGDGEPNAVEIAGGSNPWSFESDAELTFDTDGILLDAEGRLEIRIDGAPGYGVLFAAADLQLPDRGLQVPGIDGQLTLQIPLSIGLPIRVPSTVVVQVPRSQLASHVYLQPLIVPASGGQPSFGEVAAFRLASAAESPVQETFGTGRFLDVSRSSGRWELGRATPGVLGSIGRLGDFDHTVGVEVEPSVFEFNTDRMAFPATTTLFGRLEIVSDGIFDFTRFVVPAGVTVRFMGPKPAVLRVNGEVRIDGTLSVNGERMTADGFVDTDPRVGIAPLGQSGGRGGAGGGDGGAGADGSLGTGATADNFGRPGSDLMAPALSAYYASRAGTGGPGASLFPVNGLSSSVTFGLLAVICVQIGSGGNGGGFQVPGSVASFGPHAPPVTFGPLAPPSLGTGSLSIPFGARSADHFLVGGSGGGGGGSHALGFLTTEIVSRRSWRAGSGGAGGGGALMLRSGGGIRVTSLGRISSDGGHAATLESSGAGSGRRAPAPGGGGSGGSVLLQTPSVFDQRGTISIRGGEGGELSLFMINSTFRVSGGDGAPGSVRLEKATTPALSELGTVSGPSTLPAESVGALTETDAILLQQSTWYPSPSALPQWLHYELIVDTDGIVTTYGDDPAAFRPAIGLGLPVQFYMQVGTVGLDGVSIEATSPWEAFTNRLNLAEGTHVRFMLVFDRSAHQSVSVTGLTIRTRSSR